MLFSIIDALEPHVRDQISFLFIQQREHSVTIRASSKSAAAPLTPTPANLRSITEPSWEKEWILQPTSVESIELEIQAIEASTYLGRLRITRHVQPGQVNTWIITAHAKWYENRAAG